MAAQETDATVHRDLVVVGASAGGVEALRRLVAALPPDLPAAVCVVLHVSESTPSALAGILARAGRLASRPARDGDELTHGQILVAPPGHHLIVEGDHVRLTVGPRENNHRPSVDALFRSASESARDRVTGVVLSGMRDDGAAGLGVVKANGGLALVQEPDDAVHPGMPSSAIAHVAVDQVLTCEDLAAAISNAAWGGHQPARGTTGPPPISGRNLTLVCPECGGVLSETLEAGVPRWECHVGHLYSPDSLGIAQGTGVERAMWTAARMLRDRAALLRRLADLAQARGHSHSEQKFRSRATEADHHAEAVLAVIAGSAGDHAGAVTEDEEVA